MGIAKIKMREKRYGSSKGGGTGKKIRRNVMGKKKSYAKGGVAGPGSKGGERNWE